MQVSSSDRNVSFTEAIGTLVDRQTQHVQDSEWIHFLQDHFEQLRANSTYFPLDETTMLRFQYRILDFLTEQKYVLGIDQAFRIVNRLHNDQEFNTSLTGVYLPDSTFVSELRRKFVTNKAMFAKFC